MTLFRPDIRIGDVFDRLAEIPDESIDCIVTSSPYWGLRDYDVEGQLGSELTWDEHLQNALRYGAEFMRVLKPHGSLWFNYGDCHACAPNGRSAAETKAEGNDNRTFRNKPHSTVQGAFKPKDLILGGAMIAIAYQQAGWWLRSHIVWGKPNAMPDSSGTSRPSLSHEQIFLFSKSGKPCVWRARDTGELSFTPDHSERCPLITDPSRTGKRWIGMDMFYDAQAVRRGRKTAHDPKCPDGWDMQPGSHGTIHKRGRDKQRGHKRAHDGFNGRWDQMSKAEQQANGRLLRNYEPPAFKVWDMAIQPFSGAHFATFPIELAERCILAGCPPGGTVLDPFGGSGTTGLVAQRHGRRSILIELNPEYAELARHRIASDITDLAPGRVIDEPGPLFAAAL